MVTAVVPITVQSVRYPRPSMNMSNTATEHKNLCSLCRRSFRSHSCSSNHSSAVVQSVHRTAVGRRVPQTANGRVSRITSNTQLSEVVEVPGFEMMITNSIQHTEVVIHREEACHCDARSQWP